MPPPVSTAAPAPAVKAPAHLTIATRESRLALWQAEHVRQGLLALGAGQVDLMGMTTRGDQILDRSLSKVGGKGLFVKELETALACGHAQVAVHSLKDVPMQLPEGFALAAVWEREDPRDAFVSNHHADLKALPRGARVGTSSLRRASQLAQLRPDLEVLPLRGNLDTRLRKLDEGQFDAIVLAAAGLKRLGLSQRIASCFDVNTMLPAAGQGALALEIHLAQAEGAAFLPAWLAQTQHQATALAVTAERAVCMALGGSCSMPLAAHAQWQVQPGPIFRPNEAGTLQLQARLGHATQAGAPLLASQALAAVHSPSQAQALGEQVAHALKAQVAQLALRDGALAQGYWPAQDAKRS